MWIVKNCFTLCCLSIFVTYYHFNLLFSSVNNNIVEGELIFQGPQNCTNTAFLYSKISFINTLTTIHNYIINNHNTDKVVHNESVTRLFPSNGEWVPYHIGNFYVIYFVICSVMPLRIQLQIYILLLVYFESWKHKHKMSRMI